MNFILTTAYSGKVKPPKSDLISVNDWKTIEKYTNLKYYCVVNAIVKYETFENKPFNYHIVDTTDSNKEVVKLLHKNRQGIFYNSNIEGRKYLTQQEISELYEYINNYKEEK